MNDIAEVSLGRHAPVAGDPYRENPANGAFILIHEATHGTVAAGRIGQGLPAR